MVINLYLLLYFYQKFRVETGTQALDILINVLQTDRSDAEIMGYAVDTIFNIIAAHLEPEESKYQNIDLIKQNESDVGPFPK